MQGMSLVPAVTELMLAELLYLQYDNPTRPIFMYINSAGVQVQSGFCNTAGCMHIHRPLWFGMDLPDKMMHAMVPSCAPVRVRVC